MLILDSLYLILFKLSGRKIVWADASLTAILNYTLVEILVRWTCEEKAHRRTQLYIGLLRSLYKLIVVFFVKSLHLSDFDYGQVL